MRISPALTWRISTVCDRLSLRNTITCCFARIMSAKGLLMIDYSEYLEGYRDAQAYDVEEGDYDADYPLTEQMARELGGPLLDLACGTGTIAIRLAEQGFQVTGVDIIPEMIE